MGDWLEHMLRARLDEIGPRLGGSLALVDGTLVYSCGRGRPGFRVHALYEPALGRFTDFQVTTDRVREGAAQTRLSPARTMVFDRGYARLRDIAAVLAAGSDMVTRIGWRALRLLDAAGVPIGLMALLPEGSAATDHEVRLAGMDAPLRLVMQRLPPVQAASQAKPSVPAGAPASRATGSTRAPSGRLAI
jgi:hypothetical protein